MDGTHPHSLHHYKYYAGRSDILQEKSPCDNRVAQSLCGNLSQIKAQRRPTPRKRGLRHLAARSRRQAALFPLPIRGPWRFPWRT